MVPSDVTPKRPGKPYPGSKTRIRVPSFGALVIGCQFGNMPLPPNAEQRIGRVASDIPPLKAKTLSYITPRNPRVTPATMMTTGIAMFHQLGSGTVVRSGSRSSWFAKGITTHSRAILPAVVDK
jgi:hypothetical protein